MVRYADPGAVEWVESSGGPLVMVPAGALPSWLGSDSDEQETDYDRACEVDGWVGLIAVGSEVALVLGGEPASTAFLPGPGLFVRWCAGESEAEFLESIGPALDAAAWEPEIYWDLSGAVLLFDPVWSGRELAGQDQARVDLESGRYAVSWAYVEPDPLTSSVLVRMRRLPQR
ncbi:Imm21 family immunity protein [Streptomyces sp. NBC_01506]|uniref:Imm21 family immunity protein n=1 Tax=Streptomyces sp. NBC_01506 TaxID=2903887 RepID=UPI00386720E2